MFVSRKIENVAIEQHGADTAPRGASFRAESTFETEHNDIGRLRLAVLGVGGHFILRRPKPRSPLAWSVSPLEVDGTQPQPLRPIPTGAQNFETHYRSV